MVKTPSVDQILGLYGFIDAFHHETHDGEAFVCGALFPTVADAANADLNILTGAKYVHLTYEAVCGGDAFLYLLEGVVISTAGTAQAILNLDRASANTALATAFTNPTLSSTGTTVFSAYMSGGEKNFTSGGLGGSREEKILKLNTNYVIRVNNRSGAAKSASIKANFYEHI